MVRYFKLLKNKNYMLLLLGQIISQLGSSMNIIGLTIYVIRFNNPVMSLGVLHLLLMIPWILFGTYAGVLADMYSKRTIIVICDIARGILSIALYFVSSLWLFYIIVFMQTIFNILFSPAIGGYIAFITRKDNIKEANSLYASSGKIATLVGPALGGVIISSVGVSAIFILNGIAFILSGISEMFISVTGKPDIQSKGTKQRLNAFKKIKEGFVYINNNKQVKIIVIFFAVVSIWFGTFPILYTNVAFGNLGLSEVEYGIFTTIGGIGSIAGALILPRILEKTSETIIMVSFTGIYGFLYFLFSLIGSIKVNGTLMLLIGISTAIINTTYSIFLQKEVSKEFLGRVYSIDMAFSNFTMVISIGFVTFFGYGIEPIKLMTIFSLILVFICLFTYIVIKNKIYKGGQSV